MMMRLLVAVTGTVACLSFSLPLYAQPAIIDPDIVTDMLTGQTPEERDRKAWEKLREEHKESETTEPQKAINAYQAFYESKPKLAASIAVPLTLKVATLYANNLKDANKASEIYQWGWDKYKTAPESGELLGGYLKLLNEQGKGEQVVETLAANWNDLGRSYTHFAVPALEQGVRALKATDKADELQEYIKQVFIAFPALAQGDIQYWDGKFYDPLVQTLLEAKKYDAALSWAKLRFICAPYESGAIDRASRMLVKAWSAAPDGKAKLDEFARAQKDSTIDNPLHQVALPPLSEEEKQQIIERMARLDKGSGGAAERNVLFLWQGDEKAAMREAQKWLATKGAEKVGALEATRVFKASDLNLLRATTFLKWLKDKQGPSPIDEFLKAEAKP